ncbi:helix-turn-helix domain-containing protein [Mesorhizobium sp.]
MLGVHRPSVSVAAATLQRAGLIGYSRGNIRIADRKGL